MTSTRYKRIFFEFTFWLLLILFGFVFFINAWVVDDAYITFRTVDNFIKGYGLTWNISERVQVYTHPLWMLLISLFSFFTHEVFYTSIMVSFACCIGLFFILYFSFKQKGVQSLWKPAFLILLLLASKAFMDYTSSGLENPLSYLLAALFFSQYVVGKKKVTEYNEKDAGFFFFIASLAFVNRQDTILFYILPLLHILILQLRMRNLKILFFIPLALSPAILWFLFSLFYYGFPFPNTAYAKYMISNISFMDKIKVGLVYFENSISWDWASHLILLCALVLALIKKAYKSILIMTGVVIYLLYILAGAATATHMSGRFFALPFFISFFVFTCLIHAKETAVIAALLASLFIIIHPLSSIKMGSEWYKPLSKKYPNQIDTKWYVHNEGAALVNYKKGIELPDHYWYKAGKEFNKRKEKIHIGGAKYGSLAIGYFSYAAGQDKYIIDILALSDPLRARLPVILQKNSYVRSGHFFRIMPDGYILSLRESKNMIKDEDLFAYYEVLRNIISGPLFSFKRIENIIDMNLGKYNSLLDAYSLRVQDICNNPGTIDKLLKIAGPVK